MTRALALAAIALAGCDPTSFRDCAIACTAETGCPDGFSCGTEGLCRQQGTQASCSDVISDAMMTSSCEAGHATQLTGRVFSPGGDLPLPGVTVYVARTDPGPIAQGLSCSRCSDLAGNPIVKTTTDVDGSFVLDNVPTGDLRVVVQTGKWRRQVMVPDVAECEQRALDPAATRLPKNRSEGDLPSIAVTTGIDALECALTAVGIDAAEITSDTGSGRVNLFAGTNGSTTISGGSALTAAATLTASPTRLAKYDLVLFGCEGQAVTRAAASARNLVDYTTAGGRLFLVHFDGNWFGAAPTPWPSVGTFADAAVGATSVVLSVDGASPRGMTFASWLVGVGASTTANRLTIDNPRAGCSMVNTTMAQPLLTLDPALNVGSPRDVQAFELPTPIGGASCGRVVYSDLHFDDSNAMAFPLECSVSALSSQQLAVAYLIFELGSCSN